MVKKIKTIILFMLVAFVLCGMVGCAKKQSAVSEVGFDMERIRKNIIIKGQTLEIPVKLKDLPKGWTYMFYDENIVKLKEGMKLAKMFYNGEDMCVAALNNYDKKKLQKSIIYSLTIHESDCSIDGLTPQVSTVQDVLDKYGEPLPDVSLDDFYYYGIVNYGEHKNNQNISVWFDDGVIIWMDITYTDLDQFEK